jgi:hypothetical protein
MHHKKLRNSDWKVIEDRFEKKLHCWKVKYLSYGGRLTLVNSILGSLPMFMMSFFEIPKVIMTKYIITYLDSTGKVEMTKKCLAKWDILCRPKNQGDIGIADIETKNKCLLSINFTDSY